MTKEKLAEKIFAECLADGEEVTMEEAFEMAEMEIKAKGIKNYTSTEKTKSKPKREKKIDEEKKEIIEVLHKALAEIGYNATISNVDRTIDFGPYTVTLTKHRAKK